MEMKRILIFDKNEITLDILKQILQEDYKVNIEKDDTNLINKINHTFPDLILLDISLCNLQIIKNIRAQKNLQKIPIVAFSADEDKKKMALETGATEFLSKPFGLKQLYSAINRVLI